MEKRGQVGRILTSIPALIYIFFVMLIFVLISIFVFNVDGKDKSRTGELTYQQLESKVLLELFLEDIVMVNGKEKTIEDLIKEMVKNGGNLRLIGIVQDRFDKKFSCGKRNKLKVLELLISKSRIALRTKKFINYPAILKIEKSEYFEEVEELEICEGDNLKNGIVKTFKESGNNRQIFCIFVEGNIC